MKLIIYAIFIFNLGCSSKGIEVSAIPVESLVATVGPISSSLKHKLTKYDIKRLKNHFPMTLYRIYNYQNLLLEDVINMTRSGVSDDVILHEIRVTRSLFYLTLLNEKTLEQSGVSRRIINEMMDTAFDRY